MACCYTHSHTVLAVGVHLAEHNSKVGPAISACQRAERGLHTSQLCPAIRLQQGPPRCPAVDRFSEKQDDKRGRAVSRFIRLIETPTEQVMTIYDQKVVMV